MAKQNLTPKKIIDKIEGKSKDIRKFGVNKIGVFGSFVNGNPKDHSDIDIVVNIVNPNFDNFMELKFLLEKLFKKKIDLVLEGNIKPELEYIKKEAKYAKL